MKKISCILIAAGFLVACGAQDTPAPEEAATAEASAAADTTEEVVAEPECDPTDPDCDHTGTVNRPPDRS